MKAEIIKISEVDYLNEILPICNNIQNMPISFYIDELKESIVQLSELMLTLDKDERIDISDIMVKISGTHKMLTEMQQAVLDYKAGLK